MSKIYKLIDRERARQDKKWGEQNHKNGTAFIGFKMLSDYYKRQCDAATLTGKVTWADIFKEEVYEALAEEKPVKIKEELIQVMAVCKAWIECMDRKRNKKGKKRENNAE